MTALAAEPSADLRATVAGALRGAAHVLLGALALRCSRAGCHGHSAAPGRLG